MGRGCHPCARLTHGLQELIWACVLARVQTGAPFPPAGYSWERARVRQHVLPSPPQVLWRGCVCSSGVQSSLGLNLLATDACHLSGACQPGPQHPPCNP